jgi:hypothetical protein
MPKDVRVHKDRGLLEIIYTGEITPEDLADDRDAVERICSKDGLKKVLVDCSEVNLAPPTITLFDHGSCISRSPVLKRLKHAVIVPEAVAKDAHFLETISQNRGVSMRYFATRAEAFKWLREPSGSAIKSDGQ